MSVPRAPTSKASNRPLGSVDAAALSAVGLRKSSSRWTPLSTSNSFRAERLLAELEAEVHVKTTDPASYTVYADAATCVVTAAPAPVSELAVSTCVIEYVAPAPVATLLEPPVPSVHVVHVPHVHVVRNTIETPQLQILEKSGGFPATRSDVTFFAPAHVIEHVPVDTYAAPARLAPALVTKVHRTSTRCSELFAIFFCTGLVNPQFSPTCVEVSTPKVTSSCQTHQEHLVVGDTTQNGEEFHSVQEQVMVQEIPETQVIERIQEQTEEQIVDVPAPPIVDDIVEVVQIIPGSLMPQTMEESSEVFRLQKIALEFCCCHGSDASYCFQP